MSGPTTPNGGLAGFCFVALLTMTTATVFAPDCSGQSAGVLKPAASRTLTERLEEMRTRAAKKTPADKAAVAKKALAEVRASGVLERSLKVGQRAPSFSLPDAAGKSISSSELLAHGPVVLAFYRGHW